MHLELQDTDLRSDGGSDDNVHQADTEEKKRCQRHVLIRMSDHTSPHLGLTEQV